jgi:hypothetical protein
MSPLEVEARGAYEDDASRAVGRMSSCTAPKVQTSNPPFPTQVEKKAGASLSLETRSDFRL